MNIDIAIFATLFFGILAVAVPIFIWRCQVVEKIEKRVSDLEKYIAVITEKIKPLQVDNGMNWKNVDSADKSKGSIASEKFLS